MNFIVRNLFLANSFKQIAYSQIKTLRSHAVHVPPEEVSQIFDCGRLVSEKEWSKALELYNGNNPVGDDKRTAVSASKLFLTLSNLNKGVESINLMKYLEKNAGSVCQLPNVVALFVRICASADELSLEQRQIWVIKYLDKFPASCPVDLQISSDLIHGISLLPDWKERSTYLVETLQAGSQAYDRGQIVRIQLPLLASCIRFNRLTDLSELLHKISDCAGRNFSNTDCHYVINLSVSIVLKALKESSSKSFCTKLFIANVLGVLLEELERASSFEHGTGLLYLQKENADLLATEIMSSCLFGVTKWFELKDTYLTADSERCKACRKKLPPLQISQDTFRKLQTEFYRNAFQKHGFTANTSYAPYLRTTPEEQHRFKKFLDFYAPFDLIIDGLNVAHRHGFPRSQLSSRQKGKVALNLASYYSEAKQFRVLIVAKKHIERSWSPDVLRGLRKLDPKVKLFLSEVFILFILCKVTAFVLFRIYLMMML